ncbi:ester cyclase [Actinomadura sp. 3N508]|uniref:ester cyclase n=1 Tax=Actinomadura sp. 3N508 TaxID=3375153 RepID=UPI0037A97C5F
MHEKRNLDTVKRLVEDVHNQGRTELIPKYYADHLKEHDPRVGADISEFWRDFRSVFSDLEVTVGLSLADQDHVMSFFTWTGVHREDDSRELKLYTSELFRLRDDKVVEHGAVVDYCELGEFGLAPRRSGHPSSDLLRGEHLSEEKANARVVLAAYREVMTQHLLHRADDFYEKDYVHHNFQMPAVPSGIEAFKDYFAGNFERYPDLSVTVDHILARSDHVMVFATWRGTFTGYTQGRHPTGKRLRMRTSDLFRLENLKVVEHWEVVDYAGLQRVGIPIRPAHHLPQA